jgi:hypothetical protein
VTGILIDCNGREYEMPVLLSWSTVHTTGVPCDSFEVCCLYDEMMAPILSDAVRFRGVVNGITVFFGVVDEYEITIDDGGKTVGVAGRGLAALLLDNEAEAVEFGSCALSDIIQMFVRPLGIDSISADDMPVLAGYTVETGASCWKALDGFVRAAAGIRPRFSRDGTLVLSNGKGTTHKVDGDTVIYDLYCRERRYGVISEILVKNPYVGISETVRNEPFIQRGGCCRRVLTVPRKTGSDTMRYTGRYQIEESGRDAFEIHFTVPEQFAAFAGDMVELEIGMMGINDLYFVSETESFSDESGAGTKITLVRAEA